MGMASPGTLRHARKDITQSFASFCNTLQKRLPSSTDSAAIDALLEQVKGHIRDAKASSKSARSLSRVSREDLDRHATDVWNLVTRLLRGDRTSTPASLGKLLIRSRFLAFQLLELARSAGGDATDGDAADFVHLRKLALKTAKSCIAESEADLARLALERAVVYGKVLEKLEVANPQEADISVPECNRLEAEYFVLRTALAWKEERLDVAEHMYNKAEPLKQSLDPHSAENLSDVLFEIGKDLSQRKDFPMAVKWLERAYGVIDSQELEMISRDAVELRLSICQALISALISGGVPEAVQKAASLISQLEGEIGNNPVTLLLRLDLLQQAPGEDFDSEAYANILHCMVQTLDCSDSHFKLLLHHIKRLYDKSAELAISVLDDMLRTKVIQHGQNGWIEKVVVHRVWMTTMQRECMENTQKLIGFLESTQENLGQPLGAEATSAAQTLIWKKAEASYSQSQYDVAESWYKAALHPIFESSGPINLAKIQRKLILCALLVNDTDRALGAFNSMSEVTQNDPMTRYLAYKIAVRVRDREFARDCLEVVSKMPDEGRDLLYACVLDAHQAADRACVADALDALAEKHKFNSTNDVYLPALFRCRIRLLCTMISSKEGGDATQENVDNCGEVERICKIFEDVVETVKRDPKDEKGVKLFTVQELDWFCQHSYNLGLKYRGSWDLRQSIRLLNSSLSMIGLFPPDIPAENAKDLSLKSMLCNFVIASAHVCVARSEDGVEERRHAYLSMRGRVAAFDAELEARLQDLDGPALGDLKSKLALLLVFDLEAAVALQRWDEMGEVVRRASICRDGDAYKAMADCLLRATIPAEFLSPTMQLIINEIWIIEDFGVGKLAKYLRCVFQVILPLSSDMAIQLLNKAIELARESTETAEKFPREELEWLATTAFNHAVDLYGANEDALCRLWADKALNLAHYCDDRGELEGTIHDRYMLLKWDSG